MNYKKICRLSNIFLVALIICFLFSIKVSARDLINPPGCNQENPEIAKIASITKDPSTKDPSAIQIWCREDGILGQRSILINTPDLKQDVTQLREGDLVFFVYEQKIPKRLFVATANFNFLERILAGGAIGTFLWLFFSFLLNWKNPLKLTLGMDNRYSNSKTQMFSWFFVLLTTYLTVNCLRGLKGGMGFVGGVDIPPNLLLMSGLSAFSFGAAKGITQSKVNSETGNEEEGKKKNFDPDKAKFPFDLFHNDNDKIDLGDFQMIIITAIAIIVYGFQVYGFLDTIEFHKLVTLPDIDSSLLATFGLGQGAYLAKKLAGNLGES